MLTCLSCTEQLRHLPPSTVGLANAADLAMARQFFDSTPGASVFQAPVPAASRQLMENLHNAPHLSGAHTPDVDPSVWAMKMHISSVPANSRWSDEFGHVPMSNSTAGIIDSELAVSGRFFPPYQVKFVIPFVTGPFNEYPRTSPAFFQPSFTSIPREPLTMNWDQEFSRMDIKGKGKATDIDFEAAFTRAAASVTKEGSRIVEVQDDTESLESAFERTKLSDSPEKAGGVDGIDYLTDFQK